jgi:DNA-binding IclR family transcriptional regulator
MVIFCAAGPIRDYSRKVLAALGIVGTEGQSPTKLHQPLRPPG